MKINLFINYYIDAVLRRQGELELAIKKNIENNLIDNIIVWCDTVAAERLFSTFDFEKIRFIPAGRPSFNDLFFYTICFQQDINIIANTDIFFDGTLQYVKNYDWEENHKTCMALSRWDLQDNGGIKHFNRRDTADTFIFFGCVPQIAGAYFTLGKPGSDNKIIYLLNENGFKIINPSLTIKTIHIHQSGVRNYVPADILKPPFHFVNPTSL